MLNRATNIFEQKKRNPSRAPRPWHVDQRPVVRLIWLSVASMLLFAGIGARTVYLQCFLTERFVRQFQQTSVCYEPIPSRDGRILAMNGQILARDLRRFAILVHYRWLEEPPNEDWLRQQALARLDRRDRRKRDLVDREEARVLEVRRELWERVSRLTGVPLDSLSNERSRIQKRVERIISHVASRREDQLSEADDPAIASTATENTPWWRQTWMAVYRALTTPPSNHQIEPIIVQEELEYHPIADNITLEVAAEIESHPELHPGTRITETTQRSYPQGPLAAHVIGTRVRIDEDELADRKRRYRDGDPLDYLPGDRIGKTGVEYTYDERLRGKRGLRKIVKNRRGEVMATQTVQDPHIGQDVVLTLDLALQREAEHLLDEAVGTSANGSAELMAQGGVILVMDVRTGAVEVAAQAPRYDLNLLSEPDSDTWKRITLDSRNPFFPRITQMALPPGSVFKTLSAIAFLESGKFDPDANVMCVGYLHNPNRYRCYVYRHWGYGHGDLNLREAIAQSCNVYFFTQAERLGPEPLVKWAQRLGFGQPTGIDLPREASGNLPSPGKPGEKWYPGDTLGLAIGQSRLTVTPLQIVRLIAAVANDGFLVTPHVVMDASPTIAPQLESSRDRSTRNTQPQPQRIPDLHPKTLARVREGLQDVVADSHGTGYRYVRLKDVAIAGKTGTAEVGGGRNDHAWFAGYVPAERPRLAFVVVLENAGSGGKTAGPVAQKLVQAMLKYDLLPTPPALVETAAE